jgi:hypothetical protein
LVFPHQASEEPVDHIKNFLQEAASVGVFAVLTGKAIGLAHFILPFRRLEVGHDVRAPERILRLPSRQ